MITRHRVFFRDAAQMPEMATGTVNLVVTSPPYPMIEMWDSLFSSMSPAVRDALGSGDGRRAHGLMHEALDRVWAEVGRALAPSGIVCINVGDATRALDGTFRLYPNHARITAYFLEAGYDALPPVIWRKPSNKPNKFMGSGMLPPNAYVTLEHEHVLIFRKGGNRRFPDAAARRRSAYFWEERNAWFSDVWQDLKGAPQQLDDARGRSASYPFELPYRLINMYSVQGDLVLDPFLGTGTTMLAAMAAARHSAGYEIDPALRPVLESRTAGAVRLGNEAIRGRLRRHEAFTVARQRDGGKRYHSKRYGFEVSTAQEADIELPFLKTMSCSGSGEYTVIYGDEE